MRQNETDAASPACSSRASLFTQRNRTDDSPRRTDETPYEYLDRSSLPQAEQARRFLDSWLSDYPAGKQAKELRRSFRDSNGHDGAFFELFCYALLRAQDRSWRVRPIPRCSVKTVDFEVSDAAGNTMFFLECVTSQPSDMSIGMHRRIADLWERLEALRPPGHGICLRQLREDAPLERLEPLERDFRQWVQAAIGTGAPGNDADSYEECAATWEWEMDGWRLEVCPDSPLSYVSLRVPWKTGREALGRSIEYKATKYGEFHVPYVVAIDVLRPFAGHGIEVALFGSERHPDDVVWYPHDGPNNAASGVLSCLGVRADALAEVDVRLWHNPWAEKPFDPLLWRGRQIIVDPVTGNREERPGLTALEMLGLPPSWPDMEVPDTV